MILTDKLNYVKKRLLKKRNIILIIILTLLLTIILSCLTMISFMNNFKKEIYHSNEYRTFLVYGNENDIEEIKKIPHISVVTSEKYYHKLYPDVKEFDNSLLKGELEIRPMLNEKEYLIINGKKLQNYGDAICPLNFYPHGNYKNDSMEKVIYKDLFLDGKKIIGQSFKLYSANPDYLNQEFNFKITGIYQNNKLEPFNICYISMDDFDKLTKNYSTMIGEIDESGNSVYTPILYKNLMIQVDNYKNVTKVLQTLTDKGFGFNSAVTLEEQFISLLIYIPLFISIIVIIISINLIYSFLRKKNTYNKNNYGILKSLGYTNNTIYKLELLENIIIFLISFIISLIIYLMGCQIIQTNLLIEFVYNNYALKVPWLYLIIVFLSFIFLIKIMEQHLIKKTLNDNSIKELLEK